MDEAVRARAIRAFHEHGLHRTAEGTGVLVFASLFEREAVVLGDRGIHEKIGDRTGTVRSRRSSTGCVRAIRARASSTRSRSAARSSPSTSRATRRSTPRANELEDQIRASRT